MLKRTVHALAAVSIAATGLIGGAGPAGASSAPCGGAFAYQAHLQNKGWQEWMCGGQWAGTIGEARNIEAVRFQSPASVSYCMKAHRSNFGWDSNWTCAWGGAQAQIGTTGMNSPMEAIMIGTQDMAGDAYIRNERWLNGPTYLPDGTMQIGTTGRGLPMEAFWLNE